MLQRNLSDFYTSHAASANCALKEQAPEHRIPLWSVLILCFVTWATHAYSFRTVLPQGQIPFGFRFRLVAVCNSYPCSLMIAEQHLVPYELPPSVLVVRSEIMAIHLASVWV